MQVHCRKETSIKQVFWRHQRANDLHMLVSLSNFPWMSLTTGIGRPFTSQESSMTMSTADQLQQAANRHSCFQPCLLHGLCWIYSFISITVLKNVCCSTFVF